MSPFEKRIGGALAECQSGNLQKNVIKNVLRRRRKVMLLVTHSLVTLILTIGTDTIVVVVTSGEVFLVVAVNDELPTVADSNDGEVIVYVVVIGKAMAETWPSSDIGWLMW